MVRPASVEETSQVVKLCDEHSIAIVPQVGNTGLMGGATPWPTHRGIVLSVGRMNKVLSVDPAQRRISLSLKAAQVKAPEPEPEEPEPEPEVPAKPPRLRTTPLRGGTGSGSGQLFSLPQPPAKDRE